MDELNPRPGQPVRRTGAVLAALGAGALTLGATDTAMIAGGAAFAVGVLLLVVGWLCN